MQEITLVNPPGNPFSSELISRAWDIFKEMGGRSPKTEPDLWREAFARARSELGSAAFHGWYDNPIWVRGYTRKFRGRTINIRPYPRLTVREVRELTGGIPAGRLRVTDDEAYKRYLERRNRILEEFVRMYPSPADWEREGKPRGEQLLYTVYNPEELLLNPDNPFAPQFMKEVWDRFKKMGGRSPALDPELWRAAFESVRSQVGSAMFTTWHNPDIGFAKEKVAGVFPYLRGYELSDVVKMIIGALAGYYFANYLPQVTKWDKGWYNVAMSGLSAVIAGYLANAVAGRDVALGTFLGGMMNTVAKAIKTATGGQIAPIAVTEVSGTVDDSILDDEIVNVEPVSVETIEPVEVKEEEKAEELIL